MPGFFKLPRIASHTLTPGPPRRVPLKDVRPASRRGPRELTGAVKAVDLCGVWAVCDALDPRSNSSDKVLGDNDPAPYTLSTARMGEGAMQAYKAISIRSSLGDSLCTAPEAGR